MGEKMGKIAKKSILTRGEGRDQVNKVTIEAWGTLILTFYLNLIFFLLGFRVKVSVTFRVKGRVKDRFRVRVRVSESTTNGLKHGAFNPPNLTNPK